MANQDHREQELQAGVAGTGTGDSSYQLAAPLNVKVALQDGISRTRDFPSFSRAAIDLKTKMSLVVRYEREIWVWRTSI